MEKCISCEESETFVISRNKKTTDIRCVLCKECLIRIRPLSEDMAEIEIADEYLP